MNEQQPSKDAASPGQQRVVRLLKCGKQKCSHVMTDSEQIDTQDPEFSFAKIKTCPCGNTPNSLSVQETEGGKRAIITPDCCGEWMIETKLSYSNPASASGRKLIKQAWNNAPRLNA